MECDVTQQTRQGEGRVHKSKGKGTHQEYVNQLSSVLKNQHDPHDTQSIPIHNPEIQLIDVPIVQSMSIIQTKEDRPRGARSSTSLK